MTNTLSQKTTTKQPDSSSERIAQQTPRENIPEVKEEAPKPSVELDNKPRNDKPKDKEDDIGKLEKLLTKMSYNRPKNFISFPIASLVPYI